MEIMVCFDRSGDNSAVLDKAREKANEPDVHIHLVTMLIDPSPFEDLRLPKRDLEEAHASLKSDGVSSEFKMMMCPGDTSEGRAIVSYAANQEIDEIIIGIKKKSRIGKLVFGSTAQHIVLNAYCPVLTVK